MGSGKIDIWMPLYISEIIADTALLTTEQFGAYMLLLLLLWRRGTLPDNDEILARVLKFSRSQWKRHRPLIAENFTIADGVWTNRYVEREREIATAIHEQNRERARAGARARWKNLEPPESPCEVQAPSEPMAATYDDVLLGGAAVPRSEEGHAKLLHIPFTHSKPAQGTHDERSAAEG